MSSERSEHPFRKRKRSNSPSGRNGGMNPPPPPPLPSGYNSMRSGGSNGRNPHYNSGAPLMKGQMNTMPPIHESFAPYSHTSSKYQSSSSYPSPIPQNAAPTTAATPSGSLLGEPPKGAILPNASPSQNSRNVANNVQPSQ